MKTVAAELNEYELVELVRLYAKNMRCWCDPQAVREYTKRIGELNEMRDKLLTADGIQTSPQRG